jgi:hypothetical protein
MGLHWRAFHVFAGEGGTEDYDSLVRSGLMVGINETFL